MNNLENRVVVVTGAGSGIGRALALGFAKHGCRIVIADIETAPLAETAKLLASSGTANIAVQTDVADAASVNALAEATLREFGTVNILCNNAGVGGGGVIKNLQLVDWKWVIDVNLWGVIHGINVFLPHLIASGEGYVMSTASIAGLMPTAGLGPYNAAKYGVVAIMETLHLEMAADPNANVGTSVLCPGPVNTNIATAQRNRPQELKRSARHSKGKSKTGTAHRNAAIAEALLRGRQPTDVASQVIEAIRAEQFWIFSHPEYMDDIRHRNEQLQVLDNPTALRDIF